MSRRFPAGVLAVIAAGGAAGTLVRAAVAQALPTSTDGFPWDTLVVNVAGSVVVGIVVVVALERVASSRYFRPLVATGFCGGLTTLSTFVVESDLLIKDGRPGMAAMYVAASILAGLAGARLGMLAARSAWSKETS
jgi:CrcB protein